MPIYEYECKLCSHKFQLLQKMSDPAPSICPNCGKEGGIHKLISQTSFELKGSGWYVTDYKNTNSVSKNTNSSSNKEAKK
jgi:putative FmdB family regulatory protein